MPTPTPRTDEFIKQQVPHLHSEQALCAAFADLARELERALTAAKYELEAWQNVFGTSQLTHAKARLEAERYRHVREIALNGDYADLRAVINSDSASAFDAKVDILRDAARGKEG